MQKFESSLSWNKLHEPRQNVCPGSLPEADDRGYVEMVQDADQVLPHLLHAGELEAVLQAASARLLAGQHHVDKHRAGNIWNVSVSQTPLTPSLPSQ